MSNGSSSEELIKRLGLNQPFREIDVTDNVMREIRRGYRGERRTKRQRFNRWFIAPAAAFFLLLASFTAYAAAAGHIQLFNSKGKVVVKTVDIETETKLPGKLTERLSQYSDQVQSTLAPGELAAYYIKDDYINYKNGYDTINPIKFEYIPVEYRSYDEFMGEQHRKSAPVLELPDDLPAGVSFAKGTVFPIGFYPNGFDDREKYNAIKERLINRAGTEPGKLFIEQVDWSYANSSIIYLSDGVSDTDISIHASRGTRISLPVDENSLSETVQLEHNEAVYIEDEEHGDQISWYDEDKQTAYTIMTSRHGLLSKNEFIRMAQSMAR